MRGTPSRLASFTVMARLMEERLLTLALSAAGILHLLLIRLGLPAWRCPFLATTGRPCPGCGMSRAFVHLLRGEWPEAIRLHPFAPFFLAAWCVLLLTFVLPAGKRKDLARRVRSFEQRTRVTAFFLLAFAAHGAIRAVVGW